MALQGPLAGHSAPARKLSVGHVVSMQAQLEASIDRKIKEAIPTSGDDDMHA